MEMIGFWNLQIKVDLVVMSTVLDVRTTAGISLLVGGLYAAFQLHLLPKPIARVVAIVYFFPTWPFTYLARRSSYYTLVDSHVFLGAVPIVMMGHVSQLVSRGVRAVVNLCDEYEGPVAEYKKNNITQLRLPTVDHTEPTLDDIRKAIEFIEFHKSRGSRVYVHCKAGAGRSAAIAFCWLLKSTGWSPQEVQQFLNEKRRVRRHLDIQPNIIAFYKSLQANGTSTAAAPDQTPSAS
ncbi:Phosphatidylglycerophosphatase and protein-tyrosine phosphatase 1 [Aphanomyces cochlioides]|nr:Phosphatidylglycerophosphatase and protein-tyrosine phosphatase 1 [Aphanomyces cochlioides]